MPLLIGYTDRLSARPGQEIAVKVSSDIGMPYEADLVRIWSGDPNPDGPGPRIETVKDGFHGRYESRVQNSFPGSFAVIAPVAGIPLPTTFTVALKVQPWLLDDRGQTIVEMVFDNDLKLGVTTGAEGTRLGFNGSTAFISAPMERKRWYELRLLVSQTGVTLRQTLLGQSETDGFRETEIRSRISPRHISKISLAAELADSGPSVRGKQFFNGRLEDLIVLDGSVDTYAPIDPEQPDINRIAWWDFSVDIPSTTIVDRGPRASHGKILNLPTRGIRGSRWSGKEMCWRHAPRDYAAIHFHEDDLYDCEWETDFRLSLPSSLSSGVYGIRLRGGGCEDVIPIFVRPPSGAPQSKIALLFPTMTYQVYSNAHHRVFDDAYRRRRAEWNAYAHHPDEHPEFGRSTYDFHADGSGVCYASLRRPHLTIRHNFLAFGNAVGSGLRHLPADLQLVDWLRHKGHDFDVITDHDLHAEGSDALAPYALVLTSTHPEYHTDKTLDALEHYTRVHGSLVYLGGNGFYWRVASSSDVPDVLEIRRAENGIRRWEADPGEYYHALDGTYGGLWVRNNRPPEHLVGVGMTSQGWFNSTFYRRTATSFESRYNWIFKGIEEEILGDFGLLGGGAAGFELDSADVRFGTPENTVILASSDGLDQTYVLVPERMSDGIADADKGQIRSDICITPKPDGRFVFAVGSIFFCGSLSWNDYDNNISRLIDNIIRTPITGKIPIG